MYFFYSVSKILFNFFMYKKRRWNILDSFKILFHNVYNIINKVSNIRVLFILFFLIIRKIDCWPVFKQDPQSLKLELGACVSTKMRYEFFCYCILDSVLIIFFVWVFLFVICDQWMSLHRRNMACSFFLRVQSIFPSSDGDSLSPVFFFFFFFFSLLWVSNPSPPPLLWSFHLFTLIDFFFVCGLVCLTDIPIVI